MFTLPPIPPSFIPHPPTFVSSVFTPSSPECCLCTLGGVAIPCSAISPPGTIPLRKLTLPLPAASVTYSSSTGGGTLCSLPPSMLKCWLARARAGLVCDFTRAIALFCAESTVSCSQPLALALPVFLFPSSAKIPKEVVWYGWSVYDWILFGLQFSALRPAVDLCVYYHLLKEKAFLMRIKRCTDLWLTINH